MWSDEIQPAEYLLATRQILLDKKIVKPIVKQCSIHNNTSVLEVGCGNGCFSRFISNGTENVKYVGVDSDKQLLECGVGVHGNNEIKYVQASAYEMPFEKDCFDSVSSHTFLNCVKYPDLAIKEMCRVAKNNAVISAALAMSYSSTTYSKGYYPAECKWHNELLIIQKDYMIALERINVGPMSTCIGLEAKELPRVFRECGLEEVKIYPIGYAFSLSDAGIDKKFKKDYISNSYIGELKKIEMHEKNKNFINLFPEKKIQRFKELLSIKRDFWLNNLDDNYIWEWSGGSMLLTTGKVKK